MSVSRALAVGSVALVAGLALACGAGPTDAERQRARFPVEAEDAVQRAVEERRTLGGTLESTEQVALVARVSGRVDELAVGLGDRVAHGQIVARLTDPGLDADLSSSGAGVASARARVAIAQGTLDAAERELAVAQTLDARGALPANALRDAQDAVATARSQVAAARSEADRAGSEFQRSRARSGQADVIATWSGDDTERAVAAVHVTQGTVVGPSDPLVTLVDLDPLRAVVHVPERDHARIHPGQLVEITTDARPEQTFAGTVARVAPVFDPATRQARVEVEVPNPDGLLSPGSFVRVAVVLDREEDATVVPVEALVERGGQDVVFVVDGDVVRQIPVTVGLRERDHVQVRNVLGGPVVTLGQQTLSDGAPVKVVPP